MTSHVTVSARGVPYYGIPLNDHSIAGTRHWILSMISICIQAWKLQCLGIPESQPQCKYNLSGSNGCSPIFALALPHSDLSNGSKKKKFKKLSWLFFSSLYYVIDLLYCVVLQVKPLLSQTYKNAMQKKYLTKCSKILTDFTLKHIQTKLNNRT